MYRTITVDEVLNVDKAKDLMLFKIRKKQVYRLYNYFFSNSLTRISNPLLAHKYIKIPTLLLLVSKLYSDYELVWEYSLQSNVTSSPSINNNEDQIFISSGNNLHSIGINNGDLKWKYDNPAYDSPSISSNDEVIYGTYGGIYSISNTSGEINWSFDQVNWASFSPSIKDGSIFANFNTNKTFYSLSQYGEKNWEYRNVVNGNSGYLMGKPAISNSGNIYLGSIYHNILCISETDGDVIWFEYGETYSSPIIDGDGNVINSSKGGLQKYNGLDGEVIWTQKNIGKVQVSPVIGTNGSIYVGAEDENVYSIDSSNGNINWIFETGAPIKYSSPVVGDDDTLYVCSNDKFLYALDTSTGKMKWRYKHGSTDVRSSPLITNNGLIINGTDLKVYALKISSNLADSPWPMYGQNPQRTGYRNDSEHDIVQENISSTAYKYVMLDDAVTWETAKALAESRGGYLAVVTSEEENDNIGNNILSVARSTYAADFKSPWVGGYESNGWKWATEEVWEYENWYIGLDSQKLGWLQYVYGSGGWEWYPIQEYMLRDGPGVHAYLLEYITNRLTTFTPTGWVHLENYPWVYSNDHKDWLYLEPKENHLFAYSNTLGIWQFVAGSTNTETIDVDSSNTITPTGWAYWNEFPSLYYNSDSTWLYLRPQDSKLNVYLHGSNQWQLMPN